MGIDLQKEKSEKQIKSIIRDYNKRADKIKSDFYSDLISKKRIEELRILNPSIMEFIRFKLSKLWNRN